MMQKPSRAGAQWAKHIRKLVKEEEKEVLLQAAARQTQTSKEKASEVKEEAAKQWWQQRVTRMLPVPGGSVTWTPTRRDLYDSKQPNIQLNLDMTANNQNGFVSWQAQQSQQDLNKNPSANGKNDKSSSSTGGKVKK